MAGWTASGYIMSPDLGKNVSSFKDFSHVVSEIWSRLFSGKDDLEKWNESVGCLQKLAFCFCFEFRCFVLQSFFSKMT